MSSYLNKVGFISLSVPARLGPPLNASPLMLAQLGIAKIISFAKRRVVSASLPPPMDSNSQCPSPTYCFSQSCGELEPTVVGWISLWL